MCQPRAQMVAGAVEENLRLIFQTPEGARVNDAGAISLKFGSITVAAFGILPAARLARFLGVRSQGPSLDSLHFLPRSPMSRIRSSHDWSRLGCSATGV